MSYTSSRVISLALGAAGSKCLMEAIKRGVIKEEDSIIINSTSKDFPLDYKGKTMVISPKNVGCGKEREVSKAYIINAIKNKEFEKIENLNQYSTVMLISSVEGGTGSGATPVLAQYFSQVLLKDCHVVALVGFGDDVRSLANTVEFFKEIKDNVICHTISNATFLSEANGNRELAEELANIEFCKRYKVLLGDNMIAGSQNIDDTDLIKLSNTYGYTTIEYKELSKSIGDANDYDKIVKRMIYESKSIKSENPSSTRIGVILNLTQESQEALGDVFAVIKEAYGTPYEAFKHIQWDGNKEYIAFIVAGMNLPVDELNKIYNSYIEQSKTMDRNNNTDTFFDTLKDFSLLDQDKKFDMIKPPKKGISSDDFLSKL